MSVQTFRKRPVVVEAMQWTSATAAYDLIEWASDGSVDYDPFTSGPGDLNGHDWGRLVVETLEGGHVATPRDWLIKGVKGEFYFCKPDVFEATYELVAPGGDQ